MKINIQSFYTEGQAYIMTVLDQQREEEWKKLVNARLSENTPAELNVMETLWSHGYAKGAEAVLAFISEIRNESIS